MRSNTWSSWELSLNNKKMKNSKTMNMKISWFVFTALLLCFFNAKAQRSRASLNTRLDSIFSTGIKTASPGCAAAVIQNGTVIYKNALGLANIENETAISGETVFDIASLSKQFTGLCISKLVGEGKINVDADIHTYLPELPDFGKKITVFNLIHHTSGIRDWPEALRTAGWHYSELADFDDIMKMVKNQRSLDFTPGSLFSYSNTNYNLLAEIVARVSGVSFRRYTDSVIFAPLGMQHTHFRNDVDEVFPKLANSYYFNHGQYFGITNVLTAYGSSSLFTSLDDLTKWMVNFDREFSAKNPDYLRMAQQAKTTAGDSVNYGYGIEIRYQPGLPVISHGGSWAGYRTETMYFPKQHISFVVLSNCNDDGLIDRTCGALQKIFFPKEMAALDKQLTATKMDAKVSPDVLRLDTGTYNWKPAQVIIALKDNIFTFQFTGEPAYPLHAVNDSVFTIAQPGVYLTFKKDPDGKVNTFTYRSREGKRNIPFKKPAISDYENYAGSYISTEFKAVYTVTWSGSELMIHHARRGDVKLILDGPDTFTSDMGTIRFTRTRNQTTGFTLSGEKVRNVKFDKTAVLLW
jgi:CubicO group peptidase (beta-lactamase class C family)